jgi:site-specific recombinase XerD
MTNPAQLAAGNAAFDSLVLDWIVDLNERGMSARTRDDYLYSIRDLKSWLIAHRASLTPSEVSTSEIQAWLTDPSLDRSGAVRRGRWTAARSFWRWVYDLGIITANPMAGLSAPVAPTSPH